MKGRRRAAASEEKGAKVGLASPDASRGGMEWERVDWGFRFWEELVVDCWLAVQSEQMETDIT